MNEVLEKMFSSDNYPKWLVQFVYLLFILDLRNLQYYEGGEIYLPHKMDETLQQPTAKANTPPSSDEM